MIKVEVQRAIHGPDIPDDECFHRWAAIIDADVEQGVAIRIVDQAEIVQLNQQYRGKPHATNVLAFPAEIPPEVDIPFIGDIVVCAPIVAQQAADQGKSLLSHWAHMTLHGILHLQGYDHIDVADAEIMENIEIQLMNKLGFANPYV